MTLFFVLDKDQRVPSGNRGPLAIFEHVRQGSWQRGKSLLNRRSSVVYRSTTQWKRVRRRAKKRESRNSLSSLLLPAPPPFRTRGNRFTTHREPVMEGGRGVAPVRTTYYYSQLSLQCSRPPAGAEKKT